MQDTPLRHTSSSQDSLPARASAFGAACATASMALAACFPSAAFAASQSYHVFFEPSPSNSAVGYTLHLGPESGNYIYNVDIGQPAEGGSEVVYEAEFETSIDLFVAVSSYDNMGNASGFSNELVVAAAQAAPPPTPPAAPAPSPGSGSGESGSEGGSGEQSGGGTQVLLPGPRLGITADSSGILSTILDDGSLAYLTLDSLASSRDLRPDRCDLDGDLDDDLVLGFGAGSDGQIALVYLQDDQVASMDSLQVGDAAYHGLDGQTRPACGDIDGDGRNEIVVGMGPTAEESLQVFDDGESGFAPFSMSGASDGIVSLTVTDAIDAIGSATTPALGDLDGDGRDELVVGFSAQGIWTITILDDGQSGFAPYPSFGTVAPFVKIQGRAHRDAPLTGGGTFPSLGDWDGDGRAEIAVGFGTGSGGWIAILDDGLAKDYSEINGVLMFPVGRTVYRSAAGASYPAFGNIDSDGLEELLISFGAGAAHEIQIFDDQRAAGMRSILKGGKGFVSSEDVTSVWIASPASAPSND